MWPPDIPDDMLEKIVSMAHEVPGDIFVSPRLEIRKIIFKRSTRFQLLSFRKRIVQISNLQTIVWIYDLDPRSIVQP